MENETMETEVEETEDTGTDEAIEFDGEFDEDRAKATIARQRAEEKRLKAALAEAREKAEKFDAAEAEKAEAQKSLEDKLKEREAAIASLRAELDERDIKTDFMRKAEEFGVTDLDLAYLAAQGQGLLGSKDPKTGQVSDHDLERLAELYPGLVGEGRVTGTTGDAGRRGRGKVASPGDTFNRVIRDAIRR